MPTVALALVLVAAAPLTACSPAESVLTLAQTKSAALSAEQLVELGGTPVAASIPDFTAADLVAAATVFEVVDPEPCRDYVESITVPGQVILPSRDLEATDAVVIAPHVDLDDADRGGVEQAVRVMPDAEGATALLAELRDAAERCAEFSYGTAANVNRFSTVELADLPFDGDGYVATLVVRGTEVVVDSTDTYVFRVANDVAAVRGPAGLTEAFARTVAENLREQQR